MNYELELLETLVEWLPKQSYTDQQAALLQDETKRLEKVMLQQLMDLNNETQLNTYLQINLHKLTQICDRLYDPLAVDNIYAEYILKLLLAVRNTAGSLVPKNLSLPLLLRKLKSEQLNSQWLAIRSDFEIHGLSVNLIDIIGFAITNFENSRERPSCSDENYLCFYLDTLKDFCDFEAEDELVYLMIRLGYNYSRFTAYCYRRMKAKIEGQKNTEKAKTLLTFKKELRQLDLLGNICFDSRKLTIVEELLKWINEEIEGLEENSAEAAMNPMKLNTSMRVLELAYWEKLQYDNGVYEEINLDSLSEKIAFNFSSKFQEELSAPSIKSKFYPKERSIIQPIEELLLKMLADVRLFLR